jgi:hypothetical protein
MLKLVVEPKMTVVTIDQVRGMLSADMSPFNTLVWRVGSDFSLCIGAWLLSGS